MPSRTPLAIRAVRQSKSFLQLHIRAQSVFDQTTYNPQFFLPRGPPPSPKTPTFDPSILIPNSSSSFSVSPLRALAIAPQTKYTNDRDRSKSKMKSNYQDHAREYLSASDCSDDDDDADDAASDDQEKVVPKSNTSRSRAKFLRRNQTLSRTDNATRDRLTSQNQYLSLAEVYYSSLDIYKSINEKSRRHLRSQSRLVMPNQENEENRTTISKTSGTVKNSQGQESKTVYGFSKTASSMHFGHAADRLTLQPTVR